MKYHPATLMFMVWSGCVFLYLFLPFQLIDRTMSLVGFLVWAIFMLSFFLGTMLVPKPKVFFRFDYDRVLDFRHADRWIKMASLIATAACFMDLSGKNVFDLVAAYAARSDRAVAVLQGEVSNSSVWFKIAFLTYPAGFVYMVRQIIFYNKF